MKITKTKTAPKTPEQYAAEKLVSDRKKFMQALTRGRTVDAMWKQVEEVVKAANIRGMQPHNDFATSSVYLEFRRTSSTHCSLSIGLNFNYDDVVRNPDNDRQSVGFFSPRVEVGWSSTSRNAAAATACIALYTEVVNLAAEIETLMRDEPIRRYSGPDEDQPNGCLCGLAYGHPVDEYRKCDYCKYGADTHDNLSELLASWCKENGLGLGSADEMLALDNLTYDQKDFLRKFVKRWDRVTNKQEVK